MNSCLITSGATTLTVCFAFCGKDERLMVKSMDWLTMLHGRLERTCVLHFDGSVSKKSLKAIKASAVKVFKTVLISKYPIPEPPYIGWPAACNYVFELACKFLTKRRLGPYYWFEADTVALTPDWLFQLEEEYGRGGKPFMGFVVGDFDGLQMGHINGTAVYPNDATKHFPHAMANHRYPWDAGMRDEMIHLAHRGNHLMQHCGAVIDGKCKPANGPAPKFTNYSDVENLVERTAVLFHPSKDGSLIDRLVEKKLGISVAAAPLKMSILIVTYEKDLPWLKWCLRSIAKFASGFHEVAVVVPETALKACHAVAEEYKGETPLRVEPFAEWPGKGFVHHMARIMEADLICPTTDYILHMDSDCIFCQPAQPEDYLVGTKPMLIGAPYDWIVQKFNNPHHYAWKRAVEAALGGVSKYEFMRRHPAVHKIGLYLRAKQMIQSHNPGLKWFEYIKGTKNDFPHTFAEFPTLGEVAYREFRNDYYFLFQPECVWPINRMLQFHSHSPMDKPNNTWASGEMKPLVPIEIFTALKL